MLRSVYIKNIALIKSQNIEFGGGFNVLSGETGAGKSIIVDSLMLIMGGKFDRTMLRYGEDACRVEAEFDTTEKAREYLREIDIDAEDITVISRKMTSDGKSESRINGRAVTLSAVRALGAMLLDICGQNEYQYLGLPAHHIDVLDAFARTETAPLLNEYSQQLTLLKRIDSELSEILDAEDRAENIEFMKRKLREIEKADVKEGELDELERQRKILQSSGKIISAAENAVANLSEGESNAVSYAESAVKALNSVASLSGDCAALAERLDSALIELEDISDSLNDFIGSFGADRMDEEALEDRIYLLRELTRKYGGYQSIIAKKAELRDKIEFLENADALYEKLTAQKKNVVDNAYFLAERISAARRQAAEKLENAVIRELADLGMENSLFKVVFSQFPSRDRCERAFTSKGLDQAEFYLSPNAGQPLKPLTKIISGGEQSRLMLALKVISGDADDIPSLVFDEIDTGISGKIGREVAKKMALIASKRQVLCVTHLPQIAAMADKNFLISKCSSENETHTDVRELTGAEAVSEIARLSGGKDISEAAEAAAAEMKQWSERYKLGLTYDD